MKIIKKCEFCEKEFITNDKIRKFCSFHCKYKSYKGKHFSFKTEFKKGHKGYVNSGNFKKGQIAWNKGLKHSEITRKKISKRHKGKPKLNRRGEKSHWWKGGITHKNIAIRMSLEYKLWREKVYNRDNYICQKCGKLGGKLNAHHLKRFSDFPELRFSVDNGITLCENCHKLTIKNMRKYGISKIPKEVEGFVY